MKLHELKIKHEYLVEIVLGNKTFELRKNDRDYQVGDLIRFINIPSPKKDLTLSEISRVSSAYIDENTLYRITYILQNVQEYGLDKNYCILGIKKMKFEED